MNYSKAVLNEILKRNKEYSYFILDKNFCYVEMSESHEERVKRLWGFVPTIKQSVFQVFKGQKGVEDLSVRLNRVLNNHQTITQIESKKIEALNVVVFIETSRIPLMEHGKCIGILCLAKDLTENVKTNEPN